MNGFDNEKNEYIDYEDVKYEEVKQKKFSFKKIIALTLIVTIIGGLSIGAGITLTSNYLEGNFQNAYANNNENTIGENNVDMEGISQYNDEIIDSPIVKIAEEVGPSVVAITSKVRVSDWFNNRYTQEGKGSGVIFDINEDSVLILTNSHVVNGAEELMVTLGEDIDVAAKAVGEDEATDLAIVEVNRKDIPKEAYSQIKPAIFGNSEDLEVGETAIAIGNPLGYHKTVTVGVISALNRELNFPDQSLRLLQTDAAINPGNSGGALVNVKGEVIGINTIKIANTNVEGIGFAIPIDFAKPIIEELVDKGYVSRPYLGIMGRDVDEEISELYEIPIGVIVVDVMEASAAHRSGMKKGDVIIEFDGVKITSMEQLSNLVKASEVGKETNVKIVREGKEKIELKITLGERK